MEEAKLLGVPFKQDMAVLERNIEELYIADIIVSPSLYSARSFADPELIKKVRVNPLGGNVKYSDRKPKLHSGLRVLAVGNSFLRKGFHYLIEAFKQIKDLRAELWNSG